MIKVSKISKSFESNQALDTVSFDLKPGKIYGFLGPNGAGKTTTMRIMTGYLQTDNGSIKYDNLSIDNSNIQISSKLGYLPENNPLYENMRVDEYLLFMSKVKNTPHEELQKICVDCGLTSVLTKEIVELSKGYKQRVGLAQSLLGNPKYLILDEPSSGLDPLQKNEILSVIKKSSKDKTILFSSHILSEVEQIADEIIVINKGKIVANGSVTKITKENMHGTTFIVIIDAKNEEFTQEIKKVESNIDIQKKSAGRTKFHEYSVVSSDPDFGLEIFKLAIKKKWLLKELYSQKNSLEDIFKQLTK